jgi:hypothetical protein
MTEPNMAVSHPIRNDTPVQLAGSTATDGKFEPKPHLWCQYDTPVQLVGSTASLNWNDTSDVSMTPRFNLRVQLPETESLNGNNTSDDSTTPQFNLRVQLLETGKFEWKQHLWCQYDTPVQLAGSTAGNGKVWPKRAIKWPKMVIDTWWHHQDDT